MKTILKTNNKILQHKWDIGTGLKFDGINDYVTSSIPSFAFSEVSPFSISMIINVISSNSFVPIGYGGNRVSISTSKTWFLNIVKATNKIVFGQQIDAQTGNIKHAFTNIEYGVQNIIVTKDSTKSVNGINIYLNGIKITNTIVYLNNMTTMSYNTNKLEFSMFDTALNAPCIIYDTKIFNKELSQAEVTELYLKQGQIVPSTAMSSLQLDMRFNDKSGTIAKDNSTNGYNGTLVNYAAGTTDLGATNMWCDKYGNSLTQY